MKPAQLNRSIRSLNTIQRSTVGRFSVATLAIDSGLRYLSTAPFGPA